MKTFKTILISALFLISSLFAADVNLAWDANAPTDLVTEYTLVYGTTSGSLSSFKTVSGGSTTSTTITGLADNTLYFFAIKAKNASGESPLSNEINYTTPVAPPVYTYLQRTNWIPSVSSEELVGEAGGRSRALDGINSTIWHSAYGAVGPHFFSVNLGATANISGVSYLPRQDSQTSAAIRNFDVETSLDGLVWTVVSSGEFASTKVEKTVIFPSVQAKFVKLVAKTAWTGSSASIAEFKVIGTYIPILSVPSAPTGLKVQLQ